MSSKPAGRRGEPPIRCAIYTRKSSEEGLEQEFNSLHAQREACEAFILSQKHEGWGALPARYDDGAFSGGTMERPALKQMLADIEAGLIDIVVVYKVDRLTRSLADFAKIVEIFDRHGSSFVSVTQQFNTTTSMGRLTLNVLLSFAQFEREVTGERIRDKIAASKKKGMWMGGFVPLGYRAKDRSLVIDECEAETVRTLFSFYLQLGNVRLVKDAADRLGLTTKRRLTATGRSYGGCRFSRGAIYKILSNPVYVGEIVHKTERHPGAHLPIVDRDTWEKVQSRLAENASRQKAQATATSPSLLAGLIFDEAGQPLTPTHANKQGRRYRYYVSQALVNGTQHSDENTRPGSWRLPASAVEALVVNGLCDLLLHPVRLTDQLLSNAFAADQVEAILARARQLGDAIQQAFGTEQSIIRKLVQRITIASDSVKMDLDRPALLNAIARHKSWADDKGGHQGTLSLTLPVTLKRRGSELKLVLCDRPQPVSLDQVLIANLAELKTGAARSLGAIAEREGISARLVRRYLDLALLPTDIIEGMLARTAADRADHRDGEALLSASPQLGSAASGPRLQLNSRAAILDRFTRRWPAALGARLTHLLTSSAAGSQWFPMSRAERKPYRQNGRRSTKLICPPNTANRRCSRPLKGRRHQANTLKNRRFLCLPQNQWNGRD